MLTGRPVQTNKPVTVETHTQMPQNFIPHKSQEMKGYQTGSDGSYSVQTGLLTGEGESEAQRKASVLHPHVVQEVRNTLNYVVK